VGNGRKYTNNCHAKKYRNNLKNRAMQHHTATAYALLLPPQAR
jgi:hypothetical protein